MSAAFVCIALAGLLCGWLVLHGLAIGVLSLAMVLVSAGLGRWEPLLILQLFDILALFQVSFLIGAAARVGLDTCANGSNAAPVDVRLGEGPVPVVEDGPPIAMRLAAGRC
jgi:hypothetical protein